MNMQALLGFYTERVGSAAWFGAYALEAVRERNPHSAFLRARSAAHEARIAQDCCSAILVGVR